MQTLTFSTTFDILDEIRTFVGNQAREAGFNAKEIYSIQLATDEAASNVIEHAYDGKADGKFEVSCEFRKDRLDSLLCWIMAKLLIRPKWKSRI